MIFRFGLSSPFGKVHIDADASPLIGESKMNKLSCSIQGSFMLPSYLPNYEGVPASHTVARYVRDLVAGA